jgi:hypothetical protein
MYIAVSKKGVLLYTAISKKDVFLYIVISRKIDMDTLFEKS